MQLSEELEQLASWEERVRRAVAELAGCTPHPADALAAAGAAFYRKLAVADSYKPSGRLRAPVHLFTASDNYVTLGEDYGLRALCEGALHTQQLAGTHRSVVAGAAARAIAERVNALLGAH